MPLRIELTQSSELDDALPFETPPPGDAQSAVQHLRQLVASCFERQHVKSALFFADKLATLSPSSPSDVLLLARATFAHREFYRTIDVIKRADLLAVPSPFNISLPTLEAYLLAGQSMLMIKHKEECLDLLAKVLPEDEAGILAFAKRYERAGDGVNIAASLSLLLGETFEAIGNRDNALIYYRIALRCDVRCAEAFFHLVEKQMLSTREQRELMQSLDFTGDQTGLLRELYALHLDKYDATCSVEQRFASIERQHGMKDNTELAIAKAETEFYQHNISAAFDICERVHKVDPYNFKVIPVYVASLVELRKKRELYHYAHQLVDVYPKKACSWYAVGCYYLLTQKFESAQRYFHKATSLEPGFSPAWIGFGNAFAAQDESDQAMSSYRTASTLFPGCHLPQLYIGMEHLRTNNLTQALEFFRRAEAICPHDPLIYNEMGSVFYKQRDYRMAIDLYTRALELCEHLPERLMDMWEPTLSNLAHAHRKLKQYDDAIRYFRSALRLAPRSASNHAALGFTFHMKGQLDNAIECYHTLSTELASGSPGQRARRGLEKSNDV
ncbi:hypothetical protein ATCC90586_011819 [Pythium insidiosum]|nr:hypothetical protein ATCC90586_011819 [Pythium insidiosum]